MQGVISVLSYVEGRLHSGSLVVGDRVIDIGSEWRTFSNKGLILVALEVLKEGVPQTFKEVCAVSQTSKKEIGRVFKLVQAALDISVEAITTGDLMSRFCCHLGLSNSVRNAATAVAKAAEDLSIVTGRSPLSVAASIYIVSQASKFNRLQKENWRRRWVERNSSTSLQTHVFSSR
ncbi:Transcription initiation factor IIB [Orchesella cincta]|uniref:Transcription initiation factor IIB n=1 Tax=Orchesella cincta TaxID=48709 RepID=A0A1D2M4T4_ORCCI|nr:Transcription initiation factor IIB [Orchesella cincta]